MNSSDALSILKKARAVTPGAPIVATLCSNYHNSNGGLRVRSKPLRDKEIQEADRPQRMKKLLREAVGEIAKERKQRGRTISWIVESLDLSSEEGVGDIREEESLQQFASRLDSEIGSDARPLCSLLESNAQPEEALSYEDLPLEVQKHVQSFLPPDARSNLGAASHLQRALHIQSERFLDPERVVKISQELAAGLINAKRRQLVEQATRGVQEALYSRDKVPKKFKPAMDDLVDAWKIGFTERIKSRESLWVATFLMLQKQESSRRIMLELGSYVEPEDFLGLAAALGQLKGGLKFFSVSLPEFGSGAGAEPNDVSRFKSVLSIILASLANYSQLTTLSIRHSSNLSVPLSAFAPRNAKALKEIIANNRNLKSLLFGGVGGKIEQEDFSSIIRTYRDVHPDGQIQLPGAMERKLAKHVTDFEILTAFGTFSGHF